MSSKLKIIAPHSELKVNMTVNADIITNTKDNAIVIPREALINKDEKSKVFIIRKDRAIEQEITTGIRSYASLEAISGLEPGAAVAISNLKELKNKGRVKVAK